jgi:hypothetical protein
MEEGSVMAEVVSQEESLDCLLFVSLYCKNYRKDSGFWEQASEFFLSAPDAWEDGDAGPDGFGEQYAEDCLSFIDKGKAREIVSNNYRSGRLTGNFFIVSNRGCLFGDYDHKQRL